MKNQYFADKRDFFKYELLLDLLERVGGLRRLVSALMLTPDDATRQGGYTRYDPGARRKPLYDFLQACLDGGLRRVSALRRFMDDRGVEYVPLHDDRYFRHERRGSYFERIAAEPRTPSLIFFDPDIGLETGTRAYMDRAGPDKYLLYDEVAAVAQSAAAASVLVVYQHLARNKHLVRRSLEVKAARLRAAIGVPAAAIVADRDVAFLVTSRSGRARDAAAACVIEHGRRLGLHAAIGVCGSPQMGPIPCCGEGRPEARLEQGDGQAPLRKGTMPWPPRRPQPPPVSGMS